MLAEFARHTVLLILGVRPTCCQVGRPLDDLSLRRDGPRDVEDVQGGRSSVAVWLVETLSYERFPAGLGLG